MIGFTGAGLDRADHVREDADALAALTARADARMLPLIGMDPVIGGEGRLAWDKLEGAGEHIFLGLEDGAPLFAPIVEARGGNAFAAFRFLSIMHAQDAAIWGTARSLNEWHGRHRFCGICSAATTVFRAGWGRRCTGCGTEHFPRVDPVVIMLAEHEDRALLGRQPRFPPRRYSALAGFVEPGESIEEAVARELKEEAGVTVGDVRYIASQPWPFPGQLMIACIARAEDATLTLDEKELEHAFWATRDEVAAALAGDPDAPFQAPPPFAIAYSLLGAWLNGSGE